MEETGYLTGASSFYSVAVHNCAELAKNWIRSEVYRRALAKAYAADIAATAEPGIEIPMMESERYSRLRSLLENVPPPLREVVVLFYLEEFSIKEIAGVLEITISTAKKRLERGRKQLRNYFELDWKKHLADDSAPEDSVTRKVIGSLSIGPAMPLAAYMPSGSLAAISLSSSEAFQTTLLKEVLAMSVKKASITTIVIFVCVLGAFLAWKTSIDESLKAPVEQEIVSVPVGENSPA